MDENTKENREEKPIELSLEEKQALKNDFENLLKTMRGFGDCITRVQEKQKKMPGEGLDWNQLTADDEKELKESLDKYFLQSSLFLDESLAKVGEVDETSQSVSDYRHDVARVGAILQGANFVYWGDGDCSEDENGQAPLPLDPVLMRHLVRITRCFEGEIVPEEKDSIASVNLKDLLEDNLSLVKTGMIFEKMLGAKGRHLNLSFDCPENLHILGRESDLYRAVYNIVRNSEIFLDERVFSKGKEGKIDIRAKEEDGEIKVEIEDNALGIDTEAIWKSAVEKGIVKAEETMSKEQIVNLIFGRGVSGRESTGKGLAISKEKIEEAGGKIEVENHPGEGVKFIITLPRSQ